MELFSSRLRKLRLEIDKTQREMAVLGDTSTASYNRYEKGEAEPPASFLFSLRNNIPNLNTDYFSLENAPMFTSQIEYSQFRVNEPLSDYEAGKLHELEDQVEKLWHTVRDKTEDPKARIQTLESMILTLTEAIGRIPVPETKKESDV